MYALKDLAESVDLDTSEKLTIDVNLYLTGDPMPASQPTVPPPPFCQPRARTATVIQEEGLACVVPAEHMGAGATLAIKDTWRCEDEECKNWPWVCWVPRTVPRAVEHHYPVNPNIISMWAKAIDQRQCTVLDPNDRIKAAIMRARERSHIERVRSRQRGVGGGG